MKCKISHTLTLIGLGLFLFGCGAEQPCGTETNGNVQDDAPQSRAGADQVVEVGAQVSLNGENSSNADSPISFKWELISSPSFSFATFFKPFMVNPSFTADKSGSYCAKLMVSDSDQNGEPDYVSIDAVTGNIAPVANAGKDQFVGRVSTINLNGSASFDNNNDSIEFTWRVLSKPAASNADFSDSTQSYPAFVIDVEGEYDFELIVSDGELNSEPDTVRVIYQQQDQLPLANAGNDQNNQSAEFQLDASGSSDPEGNDLSYRWTLISRPPNSEFELSTTDYQQINVVADEEGSYLFEVTVSDELGSSSDRVIINYDDPNSGTIVDSFEGSGDLTGVVTNNESALPDVVQSNGRYRANLTNNSNNITLHYNEFQGRLDAWKTRFPFEFIARNIGIGSQSNSQTPHSYRTNAFNFSGVQVHSLDLDSANSAHVVVGHRGSEARYTIEGKNTVNGKSSVNDIGSYVAPDARADIRVVGDESGQLTVYWQQPNMNADKALSDTWRLYNSNGSLPGTQANFGSRGSSVYVGLITYAYNSTGIPFVGTCDSIEIIEK